MPPKLVLAPAASGKTLNCIHAVRRVAHESPLATVWAVLPDRNQAGAFNRRLALEGGALGALLGTFRDLYAELLALVGQSIPLAPEPLVHRLTRAAVDSLDPALRHYQPIARRPGFIVAASELIAELKRALIDPGQFAEAVGNAGPRLTELALIYAGYQSKLKELNWADDEGLAWLAVRALEDHPALAADWRLVVVDGFDSFNPVSLKVLQLLATRVGELRITLSGDAEMTRPVYRRFARTLGQLNAALAPEIEFLPPHANRVSALSHLASCLFEQDAERVDSSNDIRWIEAQTQRLEAREALRWLKSRIVRDQVSPDECAVIARDLESYRPFVKEAAVEFGLPLRFLGGEALEKNPAIAALLNLLALAPKWERRPLVDAVRSPYFDLAPWGLSAQEAPRLDRVARYGQVVEGLEQWRQVLAELARDTAEAAESDDEERLPVLIHGAGAERLMKGLEGFATRASPPQSGSIAEYVEWVRELAFGPDGVGLLAQAQKQEDTAARDLAALIAFGETLQALVQAEAVTARAEMSWDEFLAELQGSVRGVTYNADDPSTWRQARIYAGNLNTTRGIPYQAAVVLGLAEGLFPAPVAEDPLLSDDDRGRLIGLGLPLEPRARSDQQTQFYEAATRSNKFLLLTRPYLADDGEAWEPSPYWLATQSLFMPESAAPLRVRVDETRPPEDAASNAELYTLAMRGRRLPDRFAALDPEWQTVCAGGEVLCSRLARKAGGKFEGQADELSAQLADRYGASYVWSASGLEKFGTCPLYFYLESALDLERLELPEVGFDSAQLGSILHKILEQVYPRMADPLNAEAALPVLRTVAEEVFETAPEQYHFRPSPLWEKQKEELLEILENTLRELGKQSDGFRPHRYEAKYGLEGSAPLALETAAGIVQLHGIIDRVDRNEEGELRIIDYKTGSRHFSPGDLLEGRRLQLPLYAAAAESCLGLGRVVDGFYWGINQARPSALRLSRFSARLETGEELNGAAGAVELAARHLGADIAAIRAGRFIPSAPDGGCPKYCPGMLFCWRYAPGEF